MVAPTAEMTVSVVVVRGKLQEYKDGVPQSLSRRLVNDRGKETSGLCEEIASDIAMEMDAAGQDTGVAFTPRRVAGVTAVSRKKVAEWRETPVTRQGRKPPIGAGSLNAGWHSVSCCGFVCAVNGTPAALRYMKAVNVLTDERSVGTCGNGKSALDALLVSHGGSCVPIPCLQSRIAFHTACLGIVRHSPCFTVHRVRPSCVSVQTYLRVSEALGAPFGCRTKGAADFCVIVQRIAVVGRRQQLRSVPAVSCGLLVT